MGGFARMGVAVVISATLATAAASGLGAGPSQKNSAPYGGVRLLTKWTTVSSGFSHLLFVTCSSSHSCHVGVAAGSGAVVFLSCSQPPPRHPVVSARDRNVAMIIFVMVSPAERDLSFPS